MIFSDAPFILWLCNCKRRHERNFFVKRHLKFFRFLHCAKKETLLSTWNLSCGWTRMVWKMTQRCPWIDLENGMRPSGKGSLMPVAKVKEASIQVTVTWVDCSHMKGPLTSKNIEGAWSLELYLHVNQWFISTSKYGMLIDEESLE